MTVIPTEAQLATWVERIFDVLPEKRELSIHIVNKEEMATLNTKYRGKEGPTNVLSFPAYDGMMMMGDVVLCAPVIEEEAERDHIDVTAHFAHMVVHGVLHLSGFDHETETEADEMEKEEIKILATLGFDSPYEITV